MAISSTVWMQKMFSVVAVTSSGLVCALLNLRRSWIVKASAARRQAQRRTPALSQH